MIRDWVPVCLVTLVVILSLAIASAAFVYDPPAQPICPAETK